MTAGQQDEQMTQKQGVRDYCGRRHLAAPGEPRLAGTSRQGMEGVYMQAEPRSGGVLEPETGSAGTGS